MKHALVRRDLLELEQRLCECLGRILPFETHAVYFPQEVRTANPEWLPEEGKLLLPLVLRGNLLGVFMARISDGDRVAALLPSLPGIAALCLENLELYKCGRLDALTGLSTRQVLLERLLQETENIRSSFARGFGGEEDPRTFSGSMGLIVVSFDGLREVARNAGYGFADRLAAAMAAAFASGLPGQVLGARTGDCSFAAFVPGASRPECEALAADLVRRLDQVRLPDPLTGRRLGVMTCAGYALFPQDMDGVRQRHVEEQPRILLHKAELAADVARTRPEGLQPVRVMGYGRLLLEGGCVRQVFPFSRVLTSLGHAVGAREGQRFSVWSVNYSVRGREDGESLQPLYKGEIVLLEVREFDSVAEILHLGDPAWQLEPGDALTLLPEERTLSLAPSAHEEDGVSHRPDPLTGLLRHGDFLARLAQTCVGHERFGLALLHVDLARVRDDDSIIRPAAQPEHLMAQVAGLCREAFVQSGNGAVLGGRFGLNSLIFCHPDLDAAGLKSQYETLCGEAAARLGVRLGAGLAFWPFLRFRPADMIECSRKALEYGLLLPAPHVGLFGSLAMNISADKRHSRGDVFGAIEEYKLALLADEDNALAWNSLGVCMATLGRHAEARGFFEEALKRTPEDPTLAYNLGAVCQTLHDTAAAAEHFRTCLELAPDHMYAEVRLGQLAEAAGNPDEARFRYESAAALDAGSPLPFRHLALLALHEGRQELAREHLHQALLRNPRDAAALSLMAGLYLDGGEDPELAEALARQSVARRPDHRKGWLVLARALEVLGRKAEAREALLKAGEA